jgi:hypothetical protein
MVFEDEEKELLKHVMKTDNLDLENNTDLLDSASAAEPKKLTESEIAALPQDKIIRKKEDFNFGDFLPENPTFQPISEARKKEIEKENQEIYNGYLLWQSLQPDFKLHVKVAQDEETGEAIWLEKSFKYTPVTKGQQLRLQLRSARIFDLKRKKDELSKKPPSELTDDEKFELGYVNSLMNIASYKVEELQAKLYFNMNAEDFAAINTAEYSWALSAAQYKERFVPFSKPKQSTPGFEAVT